MKLIVLLVKKQTITLLVILSLILSILSTALTSDQFYRHMEKNRMVVRLKPKKPRSKPKQIQSQKAKTNQRVIQSQRKIMDLTMIIPNQRMIPELKMILNQKKLTTKKEYG